MTQEWKKKKVEELTGMIDEYSVIGIVNMYKMPAPQLQTMRKELSEKAKIMMAKKSLIKFALEKSKKKGVKDLEKHLKGQPTFLFTNTNPFEIFKFIKENKTQAPAKVGDIAPNDIVLKAGDTGLPAGPAIGNIADVGAIAKVQDGKIHVTKDKVITKEGEEISAKVASVLNLLGMEPMEIGLDLVAVYENETIFDKKVLDIDEEEFRGRLMSCITGAINLSVNSSYITKTTAPIIIRKAFMEAKSLALEAGIYTEETINEILSKAYGEAMSLKKMTEK